MNNIICPLCNNICFIVFSSKKYDNTLKNFNCQSCNLQHDLSGFSIIFQNSNIVYYKIKFKYNGKKIQLESSCEKIQSDYTRLTEIIPLYNNLNYSYNINYNTLILINSYIFIENYKDILSYQSIIDRLLNMMILS